MVFRSHPQLVQGLFNAHWFGPPPRVTGGSAWPRIDHPASGLPRTTGRALRTRFRFGYATGFASPPRATRRLIMQKARSHPKGAPAVWGRAGSGSLSLPSRGSFHLSLTVLVRYRSAASVQPWGVGPPDSDGVSRVPAYLGSRWAGGGLRARGCHPLRRAFPGPCARRRLAVSRSRDPAGQVRRFGHRPRSLAATGGITVVFSSSGY